MWDHSLFSSLLLHRQQLANKDKGERKCKQAETKGRRVVSAFSLQVRPHVLQFGREGDKDRKVKKKKKRKKKNLRKRNEK